MFIETSQKKLLLKMLMLTLSNLIKAQHHNQHVSESISFGFCYNIIYYISMNPWVFVQVCEGAWLTSSKKVILLNQNSGTNTASQ